jgi:DNA primase
MGSPLDRVLSQLKGVRKVGAHRFAARCPAHDDRRPSLSIAEGDGGRVLMYCHAGCDTGDIVKALGLDMTDLFDKPTPRGGRGR